MLAAPARVMCYRWVLGAVRGWGRMWAVWGADVRGKPGKGAQQLNLK
jgi:hypothetical protein